MIAFYLLVLAVIILIIGVYAFRLLNTDKKYVSGSFLVIMTLLGFFSLWSLERHVRNLQSSLIKNKIPLP